jgi:hypothetical protein
MSRFSFTCAAPGSLSLGTGLLETKLSDDLMSYSEGGADSLAVTCGDPSPAPATPTATPTATPPACFGDECPEFAIGLDANGDGTNDCGTGVPQAVGNGAPDPVPVQVSDTTCEIRQGIKFLVNAYLLETGGAHYSGLDIVLNFQGVSSAGRGDMLWQGCAIEVVAYEMSFEATGCTIDVAPASPVDHVGLMAVFSFACTNSGSIALGHEFGETTLVAENGASLREWQTVDELMVTCGDEPIVAGDADCNGAVNSVDAALVLQYDARLLGELPCKSSADVNRDGSANAIDAALILQTEAYGCHLLEIC